MHLRRIDSFQYRDFSGQEIRLLTTGISYLTTIGKYAFLINQYWKYNFQRTDKQGNQLVLLPENKRLPKMRENKRNTVNEIEP